MCCGLPSAFLSFFSPVSHEYGFVSTNFTLVGIMLCTCAPAALGVRDHRSSVLRGPNQTQVMHTVLGLPESLKSSELKWFNKPCNKCISYSPVRSYEFLNTQHISHDNMGDQCQVDYRGMMGLCVSFFFFFFSLLAGEPGVLIKNFSSTAFLIN